MTFVLTLEAVKTAAREAYAKGALGFQKGEERCLYRGDSGAPCAVGAALPEEVVNKITAAGRNWKSVSALDREGFISVPDEELYDVVRIQRAHDDIILQRYSSHRREELVDRFKSLIGAE